MKQLPNYVLLDLVGIPKNANLEVAKSTKTMLLDKPFEYLELTILRKDPNYICSLRGGLKKNRLRSVIL